MRSRLVRGRRGRLLAEPWVEVAWSLQACDGEAVFSAGGRKVWRCSSELSVAALLVFIPPSASRTL